MTISQRNLFILLVATCLALLAASCKENDVLVINDDEELHRFVNESQLGRQLFRKDSLITADTFRITSGASEVYKILLDSVRREITTDITPRDTGKWFRYDALPDPGNQGWRDAEVMVEDYLYFRTIKMTAVDTVATASSTVFTRIGWFVKYGDDNNPYAGWLLLGFNGGSPFNHGAVRAHFHVIAPNSYDVRGDTNVDSLMMPRYAYAWKPNVVDTQKYPLRTRFQYLRITDTTNLLKIPGGVSLTLTTDSSIPDYSNYMLVTTEQSGGLKTLPLTRIDQHYEYALDVPDLPSSWYLLVLQEIRNGTARKVWCVPYRVWP